MPKQDGITQEFFYKKTQNVKIDLVSPGINFSRVRFENQCHDRINVAIEFFVPKGPWDMSHMTRHGYDSESNHVLFA